jgi:hypothetical protein
VEWVAGGGGSVGEWLSDRGWGAGAGVLLCRGRPSRPAACPTAACSHQQACSSTSPLQQPWQPAAAALAACPTAASPAATTSVCPAAASSAAPSHPAPVAAPPPPAHQQQPSPQQQQQQQQQQPALPSHPPTHPPTLERSSSFSCSSAATSTDRLASPSPVVESSAAALRSRTCACSSTICGRGNAGGRAVRGV